MPTTFTKNDVVLLGYTETEDQYNDNKYRVIDATSRVGLERITTRFIYLKSRCSVDAAQKAARDWGTTERLYVVRAKSTPSLKRLIDIFGKQHQIREQSDLVWSVLRTSFSDYMKHISNNVPHEQHFISPRSSASDIGDQLMPKLIEYLTGRSGEEDNGTLKVLSANAGVGKTTLSRKLIHTLIERVKQNKTIPIYVEAQHWKKLNISSVDGLWDVIDNSLRMFSAPSLQMTETLFHYALRQGYFCFIFDGFDELCSGTTSQFEPSSILGELNDAVAASEARVLLTTRTLFWNAQIVDVPDNVRVLYLESFNSQQAKGYFTKAFRQNTPKHRAANDLYSNMVRQAIPRERTGSVRDQFVNLPLCVRMIADYVHRGGTSVNISTEQPIVRSFLIGICEREITRQNLVTSADAQMRSFQDMALAYDGGNPLFPIADLALTPNGLEEDDLNKVSDHALLERDAANEEDLFRFRYEFISPLLRAAAISRWVRDSTDDFDSLPRAIVSTLAKEADGKGPVLEQLLNFLGIDDLSCVLQKGRITTLKYISRSGVAGREQYIGSFFFHVAQSLVANDSSFTSKEKTKLLLSEIGSGSSYSRPDIVEGWAFLGPIISLDLRGCTFKKCSFRDIIFRRCTVDNTTTFIECFFEGTQTFEMRVEGWRKVVMESCAMKFPADAIWEATLNRRLKDHHNRTTRLLRMGLRKFWYHGNFRGSIHKAHWLSGPLRQTRQGDVLLEAMFKENIVRKVPISGSKEGGLAFDRSSIGDLQNYMDNNQMSGKVEAVYARLLSQFD